MFNSFIYKISNNLNAKFLFKGYMSKFKWQNCWRETPGKLVIGVIFISNSSLVSASHSTGQQT